MSITNKSCVEREPSAYKIKINYDPNLGYLVSVSKGIDGKFYSAQIVVSPYKVEEDPETLKDTVNNAIKALVQEERRNEIKELANPSFRRKNNVKQNQGTQELKTEKVS